MYFAKFYTQIRNVIDSTSGVSETINRKYIFDFRGVGIRIVVVLDCGQHIFSTDRAHQHQIPYRVKIKQRRLCTQWYMRQEIQIGF